MLQTEQLVLTSWLQRSLWILIVAGSSVDFGKCDALGSSNSKTKAGIAMTHSNIDRANRSAKLEYMQSMLRELKSLAESERCKMIGYLIEMAYVEVADTIRNDHEAAKNNTRSDVERRKAA